MDEPDVPNPINFHDLAEAQEWVKQAEQRRPWRAAIFELFADTLNQHSDREISVLELGSGPGLLARQILADCKVRSYVAVDYSAAMHTLAGRVLTPFSGRVEFVQRDFRDVDWRRGLPTFDAIVTLQAVHEVRHNRHIPKLLSEIYDSLARNGLFLFCDHYSDPHSSELHSKLYLTREEQPVVLADAHFADIRCLFEKDGMAFYSARKF